VVSGRSAAWFVIGGRLRRGSVTGCSQQVEERADPVPFLGTMPEQAVAVNGVQVAPPGPGASEVARGFQVSHDGLHGALGEANDGTDIADAGFGVAGDLHQYVPVTGQQRPAALVGKTHTPDYILARLYTREDGREIVVARTIP